jgi:hypothetical protein
MSVGKYDEMMNVHELARKMICALNSLHLDERVRNELFLALAGVRHVTRGRIVTGGFYHLLSVQQLHEWFEREKCNFTRLISCEDQERLQQLIEPEWSWELASLKREREWERAKQKEREKESPEEREKREEREREKREERERWLELDNERFLALEKRKEEERQRRLRGYALLSPTGIPSDQAYLEETQRRGY